MKKKWKKIEIKEKSLWNYKFYRSGYIIAGTVTIISKFSLEGTWLINIDNYFCNTSTVSLTNKSLTIYLNRNLGVYRKRLAVSVSQVHIYNFRIVTNLELLVSTMNHNGRSFIDNPYFTHCQNSRHLHQYKKEKSNINIFLFILFTRII